MQSNQLNTGCTQHLDHYWWAARNEAGWYTYTMQCSELAGHMCGYVYVCTQCNVMNYNVPCTKTRILCVHPIQLTLEEKEQINPKKYVQGRVKKVWKNTSFLNQHKLLSLGFLLDDQNGKTWKIARMWWDCLQQKMRNLGKVAVRNKKVYIWTFLKKQR